ncbi:hemicentin-2 isoform X2 [Denticeps clupeoides]|uniref:hemicentin-2 isoform X2 n=1 Tax=Denticeps clupeoides TaxID=299321 RepID=UPI0010A36462|nr:hemicentin-2-like isoform X2 [Denticeps clupeoides]
MALHLGTRIHQMANGSLFFPSLQEEDLGTYTCSVETESGSVRSLVKVRQAELEDVFFSPQSQTVREGDSVFLQCVSGDSSPAAHISWLKDGQHIRRGTQVEGEYGGGNERKTSGTLHIEDVSIEDKGSYICITHNPLLNISKESNAATLTVQGTDVSLEIVHGPVNTTVATETEAQLHCSVRGYPTPMVQWFKEGQLMGNGSRWSLQNNGQLLVFRRVLEEDEGFYYCDATNKKDLVRSSPAYLLPAVMKWTFITQPSNQTVRSWDGALLSCRPPYSKPPARVVWFKNGQILHPSPHFTIEPNGDLLFQRVQESDRGAYFCRATNDYLLKDLTSKKAYLDVLAPPSVSIWPIVLTAPVGAEVVIQCQVSGHPAPLIVWSKQGHSVHTGGKITLGVRNATLYISSVRSYDEGTYTCRAYNSVGQDQRTATLRVAVSPVIVSFLKSVNGRPGTTVILPCHAVGNRPILYMWTRGLLQTPVLPSALVHIDEEGTLNILSVQVSDAGEYHCTAKNEVGKDHKTTVLSVYAEDGFPDKEMQIFSPANIPRTTKRLRSSDTRTETSNQPLDQNSQMPVTEKRTRGQLPGLGLSDHSTQSTNHYTELLQSHGENAHTQQTAKRTELSPSEPNFTQLIFSRTASPNPITQVVSPSLNTQTPDYPNTKTLFPNMQTPGLQITPAAPPTQTPDPLPRMTKPSPPLIPLLEKHDIPIVVGVGVSLAFIFITMAFYSLVQKNDPTAPMGRGAQRHLGVPCRHGERLVTGRTYENRAFEDDNLVAVIEQSPNTSETRAHPPIPSTSTLMMEGSYDDVPEVSPLHDLPVLVETHPDPSEDVQMDTSLEEGKVTPFSNPDIQLQSVADWRSQEFGECQDMPSSPPTSSPQVREEGLHSSLTLQTSEPCTTPIRHSINICHGSSPLLLSHCVSLGMTTVAVDVHFYPSAAHTTTPTGSHNHPMASRQQVSSRQATQGIDVDQQAHHGLYHGAKKP